MLPREESIESASQVAKGVPAVPSHFEEAATMWCTPPVASQIWMRSNTSGLTLVQLFYVSSRCCVGVAACAPSLLSALGLAVLPRLTTMYRSLWPRSSLPNVIIWAHPGALHDRWPREEDWEGKGKKVEEKTVKGKGGKEGGDRYRSSICRVAGEEEVCEADGERVKTTHRQAPRGRCDDQPQKKAAIGLRDLAWPGSTGSLWLTAASENQPSSIELVIGDSRRELAVTEGV